MEVNTNIKLVALDMDGTLTQHKTKLNGKNKDILKQLCYKYKTVIVGAGSCSRIYEQLNHFKIDIIGNYGLQESEVVTKSGMNILKIKKDITVNIDKDIIENKINKLRQLTGYTKFKGDTVEFHETGAITFPLLGTKADISDKLDFDPNRIKRRKIYEKVKNEFKDFTVFIGGTSSFDIVPKEFNKYVALLDYAKNLNLDESNIIYFGDDYGVGGNDEHIYKSDIKFIEVNDYSKLDEYAKAIL